MEHPIVVVGNQYFSRETSYCHMIPKLRFSPHAYDAKRFRSEKRARNKAYAIGGEVAWFNPMTGEVRRK